MSDIKPLDIGTVIVGKDFKLKKATEEADINYYPSEADCYMHLKSLIEALFHIDGLPESLDVILL